ncbi:MAG: hypothetical protein ACXWN5_02185 [Candidatus Limnocylindrales bacterium]
MTASTYDRLKKIVVEQLGVDEEDVKPEAGGRRLFPLYHPAAALHNPRLRPTLVDDARALGRALAAADRR